MTNKIFLICYGTRPEFLKIKPLLKEMDKLSIKYKTLFTGQHVDLIDYNIPDYKIDIHNDINSDRLNSILYSIFGTSIDFSVYGYIIVQGDTSSALGMSILAFNKNINVIHLEAGLRTYDRKNPYPEEINRQLISRIADIHFCPTSLNLQNLHNEMIYENVYVVGNTILDNIVDIKTSYNNEVLITMHRRENHDIIQKWFLEFSKLAKKYNKLKFTFILHPNPNIKKHIHILENIDIINPLPYDEMTKRLSECKLVISDSGGLQEECSFLKKKIIVCRKITERPESINNSSRMCTGPEYIDGEFFLANTYYDTASGVCPFGDGTTSKQVCKILKEL